MPMNSTTYTVPLDNFTGTTSNVVIVSDQLLIVSHSILPLQLTTSIMVSQAMPVFAGNMVITQSPIGTTLSLISNPSLPPGYNDLNTSIPNPTQNPSGGSNIFVPPGYNASSHFFPTPTQVLSKGPYVPPPPLSGGSNCLGPSSSNQIGGTSHFITSGFQIPIGGPPQVGGKPQVGSHNPVYGKSIPALQSQPWSLPFQGSQQSSGGKHPQINSFIPHNLGQPFIGSMNPTWGQNFQSHAPLQGRPTNQPTSVGYSTQNPPQLNF
jgi:hypothetical protein